MAAATVKSFKAPSQLVREKTEAHVDLNYGGSNKRFQRIATTDPMAQQPRSYVEFYKVLTRGHREAHAFIQSEGE